MNPLNQVNIEERSTTYDISLLYRSEMKGENYDAQIVAIRNADDTVTLRSTCMNSNFVFDHSDPDRVIAIAQMMMSFAQMVKNENKEEK